MQLIRKLLKYIPYIIIFLLIILLFNLVLTNKKLKESFPYLTKGEKIEYFDLLDKNAKELGKEVLKKNYLNLIFIFKRPCSTCNGNVLYWNRIAKILKNKVKIYGIIPGTPSLMFDLSKKAETNFKIFVPENLKMFISENKIKTDKAYTILLKRNKIFLNIVGNLSGDDYLKIIRVANLFANKGR